MSCEGLKNRALTCCCSSSIALQLRPGCINPLKNLRRLGLLRIHDFFDCFDFYSFSADELDAVFQAVVWPQVCVPYSFCCLVCLLFLFFKTFLIFKLHLFVQVCRLPTESPYSPTPLLKIIHVWCKNHRSVSPLRLSYHHHIAHLSTGASL